MESNIISMIINIAKYKNNNLSEYSTKSKIRVNAVGDQLEFFIKDALSNSLNLQTMEEKDKMHQKILSYLGNQNNPPDVILKNGDAFEIKKVEGTFGSIALNSSFPKNKLYSTDSRITNACRNCENEKWEEKSLFYVIGNIDKKSRELASLFIVEGECYAAEKEIYDKIQSPIKEGVKDIIESNNLENIKTNELGKINKVDPLGITDLRIRGMWHIQHPIKVFSEHCKIDPESKFSLFTIISENKYNNLPKESKENLKNNKELFMENIIIKNPNNPAKTINAKLITFFF